MRSWLPLVVILMLSAFCVPAALADQPTFVPVDNVDFTDSSSCAFPVDIHFDQSRETMRIFSNGDFAITGTLKVTLSNGDRSVSLNVSGPQFVFVQRDGDLVARFVGASYGPSFTLPITLISFHGQILFDVTSGAVKMHGVTTDVCAALA
jgi:hypothetical protein